MKPDLRKRHSYTENSNLRPIDVFTALSNEHRQHIIADLVNRAETVSIHDLADCLASKEYEPTPAGAENALLALHHIHLPHLAAAGLITYDTTHKTGAMPTDCGRSLETWHHSRPILSHGIMLRR